MRKHTSHFQNPNIFSKTIDIRVILQYILDKFQIICIANIIFYIPIVSIRKHNIAYLRENIYIIRHISLVVC